MWSWPPGPAAAVREYLRGGHHVAEVREREGLVRHVREAVVELQERPGTVEHAPPVGYRNLAEEEDMARALPYQSEDVNLILVPGDPTAYVLQLSKPLGGGNPVTGVAQGVEQLQGARRRVEPEPDAGHDARCIPDEPRVGVIVGRARLPCRRQLEPRRPHAGARGAPARPRRVRRPPGTTRPERSRPAPRSLRGCAAMRSASTRASWQQQCPGTPRWWRSRRKQTFPMAST